MPTTSTERRTKADANREIVGRALVKGPRTGADLRDTLAVRLKTKGEVSRVLTGMLRDELVSHTGEHCHATWRLTDAGRAWVAGLLQPEGRAAA